MGTWWRRGTVALVAAAALAGSMAALGGSPAAAAVAKKDCVYNSQTYSHGAIIHIREELYQVCDDGVWKVWEPKEEG